MKAGEIVYLKPKRRRGSEPEHVVEAGETMRSISQKYGIKLKHLYRKNRMDRGAEPKPGEVLYMQSKRDREDVVKTADPEPQWEEPEQKEEKFINPHSKVETKDVDFTKPGAIKGKNVEVPDYHIVDVGDNIYRIAERYHVFEEDILRWNKDLNPLAMKVGQKIYLSEKAAKEAGAEVSPTPEPKPKPISSDEDIEKIKKEIVVDGPVYHVVVKGDTVYNICKRFKITQEQLKEWNGLDDITIKIGQKLQVSE